jgi:dihydropteroate synthase-like protein
MGVKVKSVFSSFFCERTMGKLLLVTGKLAEPSVREAARRAGAEVLVLPVSVAQFITPKLAIRHLKGKIGYDKIIFPGLIRGDVTEIEKAVGIPCFKGPKYASDLPEVIMKNLDLSKTQPADFLLTARGVGEFKDAVAKAEAERERFRVGGLKIGPGFPPRIIAEIVDAPMLSPEECLARAQYYINSGADIIDVGAVAGAEYPGEIAEVVRFLKKHKITVSVDSLNPKEINAGIESGADMVLSINSTNMGEVEKWGGVAYVVIPDDGLESLYTNLKEAEKAGFGKLIADPILSPPFNIVESLSDYFKFRNLYHAQPLLMGVGNVTELIDADSIGINGLMAAMAMELDISFILTTENSQKTRNSIRELKRALEMNYLATKKGALPKDLGLDLLLAKSKGRGYEPDISGAKLIPVAEVEHGFKEDEGGCFHIFVDFDKEQIVCAHYKEGYDLVFEGNDAESISKSIIKKGLISDLEHASYLGRELQKAEIFLKLGKSYIQDEEFRGV